MHLMPFCLCIIYFLHLHLPLQNSNHCNTVRFFQLPLSLMKLSLDPKGRTFVNHQDLFHILRPCFNYLRCFIDSHFTSTTILSRNSALIHCILTGISRPSCQRSLFTVASGMLAFAGKICQMSDLTDILKILISSNVSYSECALNSPVQPPLPPTCRQKRRIERKEKIKTHTHTHRHKHIQSHCLSLTTMNVLLFRLIHI